MIQETLFLALAGAIGALIKEIIIDNEITMPRKINGNLALGFIGSMIVGAFAGWAIDGSLLTAAMAGFAGYAIIENLVPKKIEK